MGCVLCAVQSLLLVLSEACAFVAAGLVVAAAAVALQKDWCVGFAAVYWLILHPPVEPLLADVGADEDLGCCELRRRGVHRFHGRVVDP